MLRLMTEVLGGKDCPDDLRHYLTCVSLFGVATVCSSVRATVIVPKIIRKYQLMYMLQL